MASTTATRTPTSTTGRKPTNVNIQNPISKQAQKASNWLSLGIMKPLNDSLSGRFAAMSAQVNAQNRGYNTATGLLETSSPTIQTNFENPYKASKSANLLLGDNAQKMLDINVSQNTQQQMATAAMDYGQNHAAELEQYITKARTRSLIGGAVLQSQRGVMSQLSA